MNATTTMTMDEVVTLMKSSKTEAEWDANCDKVKADFGGDYPPGWYAAVILSGVAGNTAIRFQS